MTLYSTLSVSLSFYWTICDPYHLGRDSDFNTLIGQGCPVYSLVWLDTDFIDNDFYSNYYLAHIIDSMIRYCLPEYEMDLYRR